MTEANAAIKATNLEIACNYVADTTKAQFGTGKYRQFGNDCNAFEFIKDPCLGRCKNGGACTETYVSDDAPSTTACVCKTGWKGGDCSEVDG